MAQTLRKIPEHKEPVLERFGPQERHWPRRSNRIWIGFAAVLVLSFVLGGLALFRGTPREIPVPTSTAPPALPPNGRASSAAPALPARVSPANDAGRQAYVQGVRSLQGLDGAQDSAAAAKTFWNAVSEGSIPAEVALARLYLQGEGVPKNCDQANILLETAASKGNSDAAELLQSLAVNPCR